MAGEYKRTFSIRILWQRRWEIDTTYYQVALVEFDAMNSSVNYLNIIKFS
jgi:hypothetical protein